VVASDPTLELPPPSSATLLALGSDGWAALLPHVREVLRAGSEPALTPTAARLRDTPTGRLVSGPLRAELCRELAAGGVLWDALATRLVAAEGLPDEVAALVRPPTPAPVSDVSPSASPPDRDRDRERVRAARQERDRWQRQAEGALARADALAAELAATQQRLAERTSELEATQRALSEAAEGQRRAVERERRRRDGELAQRDAELAQLRRADEQRRTESRRQQEAAERAARDTAEEAARRPEPVAGSIRVVPGRPTRLPAGVAPGTTEAARALLHRGRLVVIDGYNVTLRHRPHLDLERQRTWLVQQAATLAARRGVRPVIVFDGERFAVGRPLAGSRGVEVRFTSPGITADDEVVLTVEGTDEPVVVVTDDRELRARVQASGADVVDTRGLLGAVT
jgi:predicted RNA-binding protein with PIN domain